MDLMERDSDRVSQTELVEAARIGDARAFEALVAPFRRELHVHCNLLTGSLTDADDMLQDSLLRSRGLGVICISPLQWPDSRDSLAELFTPRKIHHGSNMTLIALRSAIAR